MDGFTSERGVLFISYWYFSPKTPRSLSQPATLINLFLWLAKRSQQKRAPCLFSQAASQRPQAAGWRSDRGDRAPTFGSWVFSSLLRLLVESVGWIDERKLDEQCCFIRVFWYAVDLPGICPFRVIFAVALYLYLYSANTLANTSGSI